MKRRILGIALALTLVMVMVMPMGVGAASTDSKTTAISGSIGFDITVTAPTAIDFGTLSGSEASGIKTGSVTANGNWKVDASDLTNGGKMKAGSVGLTNKLQISKDNSVFQSADTGIQYTGTPGTGTTFNFYATQIVDAADTQAGSYSISITFAGSANP